MNKKNQNDYVNVKTKFKKKLTSTCTYIRTYLFYHTLFYKKNLPTHSILPFLSGNVPRITFLHRADKLVYLKK